MPYHGWCFQSDGACAKIPAQGDNNPIPRRATLAGLPCREQYGYIWIWWDPKGQSAPMTCQRCLLLVPFLSRMTAAGAP